MVVSLFFFFSKKKEKKKIKKNMGIFSLALRKIPNFSTASKVYWNQH